MDTLTVTIEVPEALGSPATWRAVSTDEAGTVVEDLTYTIPADKVPGFAGAMFQLGFAVYALSDEVDNLADPALAAVEASFPTGAQLDAEDELRDRLTAEGIAHGNF